MKFKKGDRVKIARAIIGEDDKYVGRVFTVNKYDEDSEMYLLNNCSVGMKESQLTKVSGGGSNKPVRFLLQYELDEDPIEEFSTMEEVNERIKELVEEEEDLNRDSMVVYEIKSKKTVKVETKITIK